MIKEGGWPLTERAVFAILHHSNDFVSLFFLPSLQREAGAQRVTVWPEAALHLFVDNGYLRRTNCIVAAELAPAQNRCPHSLEIVGANTHNSDPEPLLSLWRPVAFNINRQARTCRA